MGLFTHKSLSFVLRSHNNRDGYCCCLGPCFRFDRFLNVFLVFLHLSSNHSLLMLFLLVVVVFLVWPFETFRFDWWLMLRLSTAMLRDRLTNDVTSATRKAGVRGIWNAPLAHLLTSSLGDATAVTDKQQPKRNSLQLRKGWDFLQLTTSQQYKLLSGLTEEDSVLLRDRERISPTISAASSTSLLA